MLVLIDIFDICKIQKTLGFKDEVEHLFQQLWIVTILVSIFISR